MEYSIITFKEENTFEEDKVWGVTGGPHGKWEVIRGNKGLLEFICFY